MQAADVMSAVQVLRAKAQAAGNLKSGSQITVVQQSPQVIVIQPANPQVVYVPQYNPTIVYGTPYVTPGYSTAAVVTTGVLAFGVGIAVGAAMSNSSWGYSYWNCNWHGGTVVYRSSGYYGNAAWHGGYYGSSASAYGPYGSANAARGYNPTTGTYARGASTSTPYGTQKVGQAYNPNTGAYAATHQASNAYGNYGSSVYSKNGNTAYTQHQTTCARICWIRTDFGGRQRCCGVGRYGNAAARHRPQMATSTQRRTAMSTRTPAVVGTRPRAPPTTPQATPGPTPLPLAAMEGRKRAAGHRPLAEVGVGNPRQASARGVVEPRWRRLLGGGRKSDG